MNMSVYSNVLDMTTPLSTLLFELLQSSMSITSALSVISSLTHFNYQPTLRIHGVVYGLNMEIYLTLFQRRLTQRDAPELHYLFEQG